jgi:signal transduction histidine kinase
LKRALEVEKKAKAGLEELDKAKSQFMMATQHHLRTPLTSMQGYLDLLFGGTYGKIPKKIEEVLKKFAASTKNEIKIVNEFLDISQFQLGKKVVVVRDGVDLRPILEEAMGDIELEAKTKGIYLKTKVPRNLPKIKADEQKLKAAIYNIIDNSVKYTRKGGVAVKAEKVNNKVRVIVEDTGVGMTEDQNKRLFGKLFERGDKAQKLFTTGRGIGLYITAKIIKAHNGKIWAESEGLGKGSTFYIELPIS